MVPKARSCGLKPIRVYSRAWIRRKVRPRPKVIASPAIRPARLFRLMDWSAQCIVKLEDTRMIVFRKREVDRKLVGMRRPLLVRDSDAREEVGREERPEEHDLRGDEEIDAEQARVDARAAVRNGRVGAVSFGVRTHATADSSAASASCCVTTTCVTGRPKRPDPAEDVPAKPARSRRRERRDDDLVDLLVVDGVLHRDDRVGIAEPARRLDARVGHEPADAFEPPFGPDRVGRDQECELGGARRAPLVDGVQQRLPENRLIREDEDVRALARRLEVDDDVVDRLVRHLARALDQIRAKPAGLQLAGVGGDDDLIGVVLVDGVLDRLERVRVDDGSARRDPGLVQKVERAAQAPIRARAPAVRVDDEACPRLVLRSR